MANEPWVKDPNERLDYKFQFGSELETTESVATIDLLSIATGLTDEAQTAITDSGKSVTFWVSGGTVGTKYPVTCRVITTGTRVYEITRTITVKERKQ